MPDIDTLTLAILELKEQCGDDIEAFEKALPHVIKQWQASQQPTGADEEERE